MSEMNENALDRHFLSQLRIMSDVYTDKISKSTFEMSQRWVQRFHKADKEDKCARNCLMLLMYSQLNEMGRLGMPFTEMENMRRQLEDVLSAYHCQIKDERQQQQQEHLRDQHMQQQHIYENVNEDAESIMDSNRSNYGGGSSRSSSTGPTPIPPQLYSDTQDIQFDPVYSTTQDSFPVELQPCTLNTRFEFPKTADLNQLQFGQSDGLIELPTAPTPNQQLKLHPSGDTQDHLHLEQLSHDNEALIREINQLHARSVEDEQLYRQNASKWQSRKSLPQLEQNAPRNIQSLLPQLERNTLKAIRRLKDWTPANGPLNFLSNSLKDLLDEAPAMKHPLAELDRKLEQVLRTLLEQAGERQEENLRILYDQLFKQQQETLHTKVKLLHRDQCSLAVERKQLETRVLNLKERERIFWEQQAASTVQYYPRAGSYQEEKMPSPNQWSHSSKSMYYSCGCSECHPDPESLSLSQLKRDLPQLRDAQIP
ncbi:GH15980 [Drosophila grimshawi]|uniref:GH15980 n=1 Tax=Drosophila grimshawi TaxID=7222 RepID=B4J214_DROGR|nr:GH15980 [Drosophila grimshawi]